MSSVSFFHYITYKLVVIRDKRLGAIYYFVALLILLYTLGEVFVQKGYLEVKFCVAAVLDRKQNGELYSSTVFLLHQKEN